MYKKVIQSGNLIEVYEYERAPTPPKLFRRKKKRSQQDAFKKRGRRWDNSHRARKAFTRLVRANMGQGAPPCLLTLTMLEITSMRQAYAEFKAFQRKLRGWGLVERYIGVPEFQKRGAVHFHCLIWGKLCGYVDSERQTRRIQNIWALGYVDVVNTNGSSKLATYLSKYMRKAMQDPRLGGERSYSSSMSILRSVSLNTPTAVDIFCKDWSLDVDNLPLHERKFQTQWLGSAVYKSYSADN